MKSIIIAKMHVNSYLYVLIYCCHTAGKFYCKIICNLPNYINYPNYSVIIITLCFWIYSFEHVFD